jgi:hypothetical protein
MGRTKSRAVAHNGVEHEENLANAERWVKSALRRVCFFLRHRWQGFEESACGVVLWHAARRAPSTEAAISLEFYGVLRSLKAPSG